MLKDNVGLLKNIRHIGEPDHIYSYDYIKNYLSKNYSLKESDIQQIATKQEIQEKGLIVRSQRDFIAIMGAMVQAYVRHTMTRYEKALSGNRITPNRHKLYLKIKEKYTKEANAIVERLKGEADIDNLNHIGL